MSVGWKFQIIQETLKEEDNLLNVSMLCDIAGVSRSGYYRWVKAEDVRLERENKDRESFELILKAYNQRGYSKGARGIYVYATLGRASSNEYKKDSTINEEIWSRMSDTQSKSI